METTELPLILLNTQSSIPSTNKNLEEKNITPVVSILDTATKPVSTSQEIRKTLDELFPEQAYEEKQIKRAIEVLGALTDEFTADQLRDVIAEIQFLVSSWLDEFERGMFDGLTLKELLHEKGGS